MGKSNPAAAQALPVTGDTPRRVGPTGSRSKPGDNVGGEARELAVQHGKSVGPRGPIGGRSEGDRRPQVEATLLERELGKAERVLRERAGPQQICKAGGDSRVMGFRKGERGHRWQGPKKVTAAQRSTKQKQQPCGLNGQRADALEERVLLGACGSQGTPSAMSPFCSGGKAGSPTQTGASGEPSPRMPGFFLDDLDESVNILVFNDVKRSLVNATGVAPSFKHGGRKRGVGLTSELNEERGA